MALKPHGTGPVPHVSGPVPNSLTFCYYYHYMAKSNVTTKQAGQLTSYSFRIVMEQDDDVVLATVPALPGCHSWGYTVNEALANVRDAIDTYITDLRKHGEPIPTEPTDDVTVVFEPLVTVTV